MDIKKQLIEKYSNNSKHSNYQVLPNLLCSVVGENEVKTRTRFENERLNYILSKIDIEGKNILDIGGNTGFFTFELLDRGAGNVHYYEGNKEHAEFVELAKEYLNLSEKVIVTNKYFSFERYSGKKYDVVLLLNVLHHFGDDYGDQHVLIEEVKNNILLQLKNIKEVSDVIVFQLGFNWKGDSKKCLFEKGTKKEMIEFIRAGVGDCWYIAEIGIAERIGDVILYRDLNKCNIERDDSLGEFLNRPLFILKAKK